MNSLVVAVLSAQSSHYIHHRPEAELLGTKMFTCWIFLGGIQHSWARMQQCEAMLGMLGTSFPKNCGSLKARKRLAASQDSMPGEMGDDFYVLRQGEASVTVHTTKGDKVGVPFIMLHL